MRTLWVRPPVNREQAALRDPEQAERVAIAIRTGREVRDVRPARARKAIEKRADEDGEEVLTWLK